MDDASREGRSARDQERFVPLLMLATTVYLCLYAAFEIGLLASIALSFRWVVLGVAQQWVCGGAYVLFVGSMFALFGVWRRRLRNGERVWFLSLSPTWQWVLLALALLMSLTIPQTEIWFEHQLVTYVPAGWPPALTNLYLGEGRWPAYITAFLHVVSRMIHHRECAFDFVWIHAYGYAPLSCAWLYWFDRDVSWKNLGRLVMAILALYVVSVIVTYNGVFVGVAEGWLVSESSDWVGPPGVHLVDTKGLVMAARVASVHRQYWWPPLFNQLEGLNELIALGGLVWYLVISMCVRGVRRLRARPTTDDLQSHV
jgi:hypothetical protein